MNMNDLFYHFIAGAVIAAAVLLIFGSRREGKRPDGYVVSAVALSLIAGLAKELNDVLFQYSTFDPADLTLTFFGGVIAVLVIVFFDMFAKPKP